MFIQAATIATSPHSRGCLCLQEHISFAFRLGVRKPESYCNFFKYLWRPPSPADVSQVLHADPCRTLSRHCWLYLFSDFACLAPPAWRCSHSSKLGILNMFAGSLRTSPFLMKVLRRTCSVQTLLRCAPNWLCGVCLRFLSVFCTFTGLGLGMCCAWALPLSNIGQLFWVRTPGDGWKPWHKIPTRLICSAGVILEPVAVALLGTSGLSVFSLSWIGPLVLLTAMAGTPWPLGSWPWFCMHCASRCLTFALFMAGCTSPSLTCPQTCWHLLAMLRFFSVSLLACGVPCVPAAVRSLSQVTVLLSPNGSLVKLSLMLLHHWCRLYVQPTTCFFLFSRVVRSFGTFRRRTPSGLSLTSLVCTTKLRMLWPTGGLMDVRSSNLTRKLRPLCSSSPAQCLLRLVVLLATTLWVMLALARPCVCLFLTLLLVSFPGSALLRLLRIWVLPLAMLLSSMASCWCCSCSGSCSHGQLM